MWRTWRARWTPGGDNTRRADRAGVALNVAARASLGYFLLEVLRHPADPRFAGKALPLRNLLVVGSLSLVVPALQLWRRPWPRYPWWYDDLYLSIFWLDMAGNSCNLYNRWRYFDLIPHFHGTGALAAVLCGALGLRADRAIAVANGLHVLLEAQEYATDVLGGTHNVRGAWDTRNDLVMGLAGSVLYVVPIVRRAQRPRAAPGVRLIRS